MLWPGWAIETLKWREMRTLTPITINLKCELDVLIHILLDGHKRTHSRTAFYQGATLALKLGAPIQVRLDPILHYWVGLTFPVMELPKHVEIVYMKLVVPPGFGPGLRVSKTPVQPLHHGTMLLERVTRQGIEPRAVTILTYVSDFPHRIHSRQDWKGLQTVFYIGISAGKPTTRPHEVGLFRVRQSI